MTNMRNTFGPAPLYHPLNSNFAILPLSTSKKQHSKKSDKIRHKTASSQVKMHRKVYATMTNTHNTVGPAPLYHPSNLKFTILPLSTS